MSRRRRTALNGLMAMATAYIVLPYLLIQVGNLGLIREGTRRKREVALTFDDGPDPVSTPAILDALQASGARATFFVLAEAAEAYPALIRRMLAEGHQVEAHAVKHRHTWLRSPWGAFQDPGAAARRIATVSGETVTLHRPPHGAYTLATLLGQRAAGLTGVHWTLEAHDWHGQYTPQRVRDRLARSLRQGVVIVLHDAGPGARKTVPLLPQLLADLRERGYRSVTLRELDARPQRFRDLIPRAFSMLDRLYDRWGRIENVNGRADSLYRLGRSLFPLSGIRLKDGQTIAPGTAATEMHINSALLVALGPREAVRRRDADLKAIALDMMRRPELKDTEVLFCISSLASLLTLGGFEEHPLPARYSHRLRIWSKVLRWAYGRGGVAQTPRLSVLSRAEVMRQTGFAEGTANE